MRKEKDCSFSPQYFVLVKIVLPYMREGYTYFHFFPKFKVYPLYAKEGLDR